MRPRLAIRWLPLLAVVAASCIGPGDSETAPTASAGAERAEIVSVQDGDSLVVLRDGVETEVRLLGINAPERDECFGEEARRELAVRAGDAVLLRRGSDDDTDRFGRLLRYVEADGEVVNAAMLRSGHAVLLDVRHDDAADYADAADAAYESRSGLWDPVACGPAGDDGVRISRLESDPPGDDLAGEFVEIVNDGAATADLSGWILRDASSANRFVFPAGTTLEPGGTVVVRSGCGVAAAGSLPWCSAAPVWNNGGDTAILQTADGSVVARLRY